MFTGIIQETGIVKELIRNSKSIRLRISAKKVLEDMKVGDSICTDGICLTVVHFDQSGFTVDAMPETLQKTKLNDISINSLVNLEPALKLNDRLGGHLVSGHIDGVGIITNILKDDIAHIISILPERQLLKYIINKGSIAIDGISLTVSYVDQSIFKVSIIPHTAQKTTLLSKRIGDKVNLETDMIAKYTEKLLTFDSKNRKHNIDNDFLRQNGFLLFDNK